jgi:hypothetical protein
LGCFSENECLTECGERCGDREGMTVIKTSINSYPRDRHNAHHIPLNTRSQKNSPNANFVCQNMKWCKTIQCLCRTKLQYLVFNNFEKELASLIRISKTVTQFYASFFSLACKT